MIGDSIKRHRNEEKISQRALAKASGVSFAYIQQLERGLKKNPSLDILNKIADALGVSLDELLNDESTSFSSILITSILRMDHITIVDYSEEYGFETISKYTDIDINFLKNCIEQNTDLLIEDQLKLINFWGEWGNEEDGIELEEFFHQNESKINKNSIISNRIKDILNKGTIKNDIEKLFDLLEKYNFKINISNKNDENILSICNNESPIITASESDLLPVYNEIVNKIDSYAKFIIEDELKKLKKD